MFTGAMQNQQHNTQPSITKFLFTLSLCTDQAQFFLKKIISALRLSNSLHQSVHIMVLIPDHCNQSFFNESQNS